MRFSQYIQSWVHFFYNLIEYFPVNLFVSLAIYLSVCLITNFSPLSNFNCFALRTAYVSLSGPATKRGSLVTRKKNFF